MQAFLLKGRDVILSWDNLFFFISFKYMSTTICRVLFILNFVLRALLRTY